MADKEFDQIELMMMRTFDKIKAKIDKLDPGDPAIVRLTAELLVVKKGIEDYAKQKKG